MQDFKNVISEKEVWKILEEIPDPEIPVISITDLGVVRGVKVLGDCVSIKITPTYTGCPATNIFEQDIKAALEKVGFKKVDISFQYSPAWTTDWLNEEAREKLRVFGIAPPEGSTSDKKFLLGEDPTVPCPQCRSVHTEMISQFGSTACKSLYKCKDCLEPFDYFKCI
ncbi:MAG: ring-1,2-phenylacetyl-CoA epoxidase subunit PaaD [Salibacteraceae bacterium]|jgi:ring-1,2-phenylacetyl-CoA epoxidase subunit PaaD